MNKIKGIIMIVILGLVAFGVGYFVMGNKNSEKVEKEPKLQSLEIEESLIKLSDEASYIKTSLSISYNSKAKKLEEYTAEVKDTIIQFFMSKTKDDLKYENIENIKAELINNINKKINTDAVKDVYFTSLVVQ